MNNHNNLFIKETFIQALKNHQNNNLVVAKNLYNKIIQIEPNNIGALNNLGLVFQSLGESQEAISCYKKVIQIEPNNISALNNLGLVFQSLGEFQKAKKYYEKVIGIDANYVNANFNLGNVLNSLGNYIEAKKYYEKVIGIDPNHKDGFNNLGVIFKELGQYKEAIDCYKKAIKIDPNHKDVFNNLGVIFKELGQYKEAIKYFEKAINIDPVHLVALNNLGLVFKELENFLEASNCFEKVISINSNDPDGHFNLGVSLYETGQYENAVEEFKLISFKNSNSYLLSCLFKLDKKSIFYDVFDKRIKKSETFDALLGSICLRSEIKYGTDIPNPFCKHPLDYVLNRDLTKVCDFDNTFIKTVKKILNKEKILLKNQGLLTNGIQTSGNFFNFETELTSKIKDIIHSEIENYRSIFADSEEGFLKKFPYQYRLNAWLVSMKNGGKLDAHIHENGWLSGSIYINVPRKKKVDSGNLVVCLEEEYEEEENKNIKKSINVVTGSICIFPASLLHYTVPFESNEERIVLAFDVIPKN